MTINQLSIFLENRSGTLIKVLECLKASGIQIIASTIADTAQYGILRIICTDSRRAYQELESAGIAVAFSDVFAVELENKPGQAADAVRIFSDAGISITYMYSFLYGDRGILVFRTDNTEEARKVILRHQLRSIAEADLARLATRAL